MSDWRVGAKPWLDYHRIESLYYGGQKKPPTGIVVHCGDSDGDLVRYLTSTLVLLNEKHAQKNHHNLIRRVSYHFVIDRDRESVYQLVPITCRAYHAGSAGNDWIGIALRGPASLDPRPAWEVEAMRFLVEELRVAIPGIAYWCRHSDLSTRRRDPGPGVSDAWFDGLLRHRPCS